MRKLIAAMMALCLLVCACPGALAAGVTIRTLTPFADMDIASQTFMDMVTVWERATGNFVEDYSGLTDEYWMDQMHEMIEAGKADIVVVPLDSGLTSADVLTVAELARIAPNIGVRSFNAMAEADGSVLLVPMRVNWEALYINVDVLERHGLSVPTTFEELVSLCQALDRRGVTPIANALGDWPEIVLDCAALCGAPEAVYGSAQSLAGAQKVLSALVGANAFGRNWKTVTDAEAMDSFINGEAAMRIDADTLALCLPQERLDSVQVMAMPTYEGKQSTAIVGTPSFGLAITRSCAQNRARLEAAISLLSGMLSRTYYGALTSGVEGKLGESISMMMVQATDCTGILYDQNPKKFDAWSRSVINGLMK